MTEQNTAAPQGGDEGFNPQTMTDPQGNVVPLSDQQRAAAQKAYHEWKSRGKPATKPVASEKTEAGNAGQPEEGGQQHDQQRDDDAPTGLSVPEETPHEHIEKVEGFMADLAPITRELNIPVADVQDVVEFAVSLAVTDRSGVSLEDPDACVTVLQNTYGRAETEKIIADAKAAAQKLGPKMLDWLDETSLGNDPSVLYALAAWKRGDLQMSASKAQAELDKLTRDPKSAYRDANAVGHKSAVARANMLYRILAKADARAEARKAAEPAKAPAKSGAKQAQEAELKSLLAHPAYRDRGHRESASVRARIEALYSTLYPGNE